MSRRTGPARATTALLLLAALAAGCASPPPPNDLHLDVTLAGGERIPGGGVDRSITLFTDRVRTAIALSGVRAIDVNDDAETVTVRTAGGEVHRGVLETETLEIVRPGAVEPRTIDTADLRALRVTPRIRIAGSGDAWWDLAFENAHGFDVDNADDRLTVRSIDPAVVNRGNHGPWSTVRLSRDFPPLRDFTLAVRIAWDADGAGPRAMQCIYVTLFDQGGNEVLCAGHHDAWSQTTGSRYSRISGVARESGHGTQPAAGRADLRIGREGSRLGVLWNGDEIRSGFDGAPVARIVVQIDFYAYSGPDGCSVFGRAALERLEIR